VADPRRLLLAGFLSVVLLPASASGATRTYSTGPLRYPIPDVGRLDVPLRVLDRGPVSYLEVSVRIDHRRDSDLTLSLVSPSGSAILLSAKRGGNGRNYGGEGPACGYGTTVFTEESEVSIRRGKAPFDDWFRPEQPLLLLYGSEASGIWKLRIADDRAGATGAVRCFKLLLSRSVVQTQTAHARRTVATLSYVERTAAFTSLRLRIVRAGRTVFDSPPKQLDRCVCPANGPTVEEAGGALRVRDLDGDGEPEVVLDSYLGAAHCCWYTDVYRYVRRKRVYRPSVGFWGNVSARLVDLGLDGRPEFRTADDRFAYVFTSFAGSAFPIRIFRFDHGRFVDVTHRFPKLVRLDAARLYRDYLSARRGPEADVSGILPAWLADQYLLGRGPAGWGVLRQAVRRAEVRPWGNPKTYLRRVRSFLRRTGYIKAARRRP
jgi:subtilisin-like proprotein convertase family protein